MRRTSRRRLLGVFAGLVGLAGCAGRSDDETTPTATEKATTEPATPGAERREALAALLRSDLERRGLEVRNVTVKANAVVVRAQTTGNVTEDMRIAGSAYATQADLLERNLTVRVEDRGLYEARFEIKRKWADRVMNGQMSDQEYLERINATRPERRRSDRRLFPPRSLGDGPRYRR